jgi:prophage regulatory protein
MTIHSQPKIKIIRLSEVINLMGKSETAIYLDRQKGVFPPSISLGERAKGYIEHEVTAVIVARIQGKTEDELKRIVIDLIAQREALADLYSFPLRAASND